MKSSFSSLANKHTLFVDFKIFMKISLLITSNFFYSSPDKFVPPSIPYNEIIPAWLTFEAMNLQAIVIAFINRVKSPPACGYFCYKEIKCLVKVIGFVFIILVVIKIKKNIYIYNIYFI